VRVLAADTMKAFLALAVLIGSVACTSNCDNAGVTVDGQGNIVVRGENGFISPNSAILRNVSIWPQPPSEEQSFAFAQGYTLTRDGAMYVLENTAQHPNLVYRINLATGESSTIGETANDASEPAGSARSHETWIAANDRYVYSVDQADATISRAGLSGDRPALAPFIQGPKTQLRSPIAVAVDSQGRVCVLDSQTLFLLCYGANQSGNVAPSRAVDLKRLLGYALVWGVVFDRSGRLVVSGSSDSNGVAGFSIAVVDLTTSAPHVVRTMSGPNTKLSQPELAVDALGDILVLQPDSPAFRSNSEILAFGPQQRGNVAPQWIRDPATSLTHAFRIAVDNATHEVAILGSDGVALFSGAAAQPPTQWPVEVRLPIRGWSLAFGGDSLIVAGEFGGLEKHAVKNPQRAQPHHAELQLDEPLNLHDPGFIATDQNGNVYAASTSGVITSFPKDFGGSAGWKAISFATTFGRNMNAFAPDSAGYWYLSSASNNAILTIDATGEQSTISGAKTGLNAPLGLAVSRDGSLFVANASANDILIFARGSSGDVAPIGRIAGPATELVAPQALAIDATGKLYVFDGPRVESGFGAAHYVRVYDVTARGNAAPLQSYPVQTKCWANTV
jgi:hypothetical protein